MSIKKIIQYPDPRLRLIARPVKKINIYIKKIINDMFDTMYAHNGIGLAATQINIQKKIIIINAIQEQETPLILINPVILRKKGTIKTEERCLSIPNKKAYISRFKEITIQALNYNGRKIYIKAKELLSICIQHEIDHLIGKLFIDY